MSVTLKTAKWRFALDVPACTELGSSRGPQFAERTSPDGQQLGGGIGKPNEAQTVAPENSQSLLTSAATIETRLHAIERIPSASASYNLATLWGRDVTYVLNIQHSQRKSSEWQAEAHRQENEVTNAQAAQQTGSVNPAEATKIQNVQTNRPQIRILQHQTRKPTRSMRV